MQLLTLQEVCQMLGCKDPKGRYVRNLRSKGILKGAKFGRNLMFDKASVDEFIRSEFEKQNPKIKKRHPNRCPLETKFNSTQTSS